jgi:Mn2+/Fe2+ NRAMP family transporter
VCEAFGFESGIDKKWKEAPEFYILYTGMLVLAIVIVLLPNAPLIKITIWSQVLNGIFLPVVIVAIMLLTNNKKVMGEYVNKPINNIIGWGAAVIITLLSFSLLVMSFIN